MSRRLGGNRLSGRAIGTMIWCALVGIILMFYPFTHSGGSVFGTLVMVTLAGGFILGCSYD